jgi:hypothetical protein
VWALALYGDPFARWDRTRWLVEAEAFVSEALQLRAVLACDKEPRLGQKRFEVSCEIEDVGLTVVSTRSQGPADRERVARVLSELDARMTGLRAQLQVDAEGGVRALGRLDPDGPHGEPARPAADRADPRRERTRSSASTRRASSPTRARRSPRSTRAAT